MAGDAIFVLCILAASLVLFVTERVALEIVALFVVLSLILGKVLPPAEALAGFSDPLVVTIGALFVVGGGVQATGLGAALGERLARFAGRDEARLVTAAMLASAALSAFMSSTGTVAILMPVIVGIARRTGSSPSRLLLPLAYGAHFGSMLTLVATPPNLVAHNQLVARGLPGFGFFTITPVGMAVLLAGVAYVALVGRRALPVGAQRAATAVSEIPDRAPEEPSRHLTGWLARLRVPSGARSLGRSIVDVAPRSRTGVTVVAVSPKGGDLRVAGPQTILGEGDVLVVHGAPEAVARVVADLGLESAPPTSDDIDQAADGEDLGTVEALLPPQSELLGRTLAEVRLRDRSGATALGILRGGASVKDDIAHVPLMMGDVLLLHGTWNDLALLRDDAHDLVVLGPIAPRRLPARRAITAAVTIVAMVSLMASDLVPTVAAALLAAIAMVLGRCVRLESAYRGVSWSSLILIAGMLPMATALERTGAVKALVELLVLALGGLGPTAALAGLLVIASLVGQFMSNTATAVLLAPIAYDVAVRLGASPRTFLLALAIASSSAFATPMASPVNTLVLVPGGYRFRDYVRVGAPLQVIAIAVALIVLRLAPP